MVLRRIPLIVSLAAAATFGWLVLRATPRPVPESTVTNRPIEVEGDGYVQSKACQACHPEQYDSWRASYHRTMTTVASEETVIPGFDGVDLASGAHGYRLERKGREFWVQLDDPDSPGHERIRRQVVMATGSHHQQVFWYATGRGRLLGQFPLTYLIGERSWVPRRSAFLQPPVAGPSETGHWSAICIGCHATNGRPRLASLPGTAPLADIAVDSHVSELGIACEACHGPGETHARANRNMGRRYSLHLTAGSDATVVQPGRLDPRRTSEVCGQCHSVWESYDQRGQLHENTHGVPYKPGDTLSRWRFVAEPPRNLQSSTMQALLKDDPRFLSDAFWPDGMVSVSGREYNGLIESPCYLRGHGQQTMTCLSCHAMHKPAGDGRPLRAWADDQLKPGMDGDEACLQCHEPMRSTLARHTRHAPQSPGSRCMNCHMPYTTYGLLKGIRSHQVSSPDVRASVETGRPDACSLCHLDKTLGWAAGHLQAWYGVPQPRLDEDQQSIAASLLWLLRGDAQQRALVAYSTGWQPSRQASGTQWMAPFLSVLLEDPYDAVRLIAYRSLRTLPGFAGLEYDYTGPAESRRRARAQVQDMARHGTRPGGEAVLIDPAGAVRTETVTRLLRARNNRIVFLRE